MDFGQGSVDVRSENFQSSSESGEAGFPWSGLSWSAAGRADALRTVTAFYPVSSGDVRSGQVRSLRREDGRLDLYDYALTDGIWTETVTHLHEQSPEPIPGKTTRDTTLTNRRGETVERKTEAFIDGSWYTIARDRMTYNATGKRIRTEPRRTGDGYGLGLLSQGLRDAARRLDDDMGLRRRWPHDRLVSLDPARHDQRHLAHHLLSV